MSLAPYATANGRQTTQPLIVPDRRVLEENPVSDLVARSRISAKDLGVLELEAVALAEARTRFGMDAQTSVASDGNAI